MRHTNVVVCLLLLLLSSSFQVFGNNLDRELETCRHQCSVQMRQCLQDCDDDYIRQKQQRREEEQRRGGRSRQEEEQRRGGRWPGHQEEGRQYERQEGDNNPYVFQDKHFSSRFQTEHGRVRVLQRFSDRSELLQGIDNYRLTILEADPQTFIIPNHFDAEAVFFVVKGKGTISLIWRDTDQKRESLNVKKGDIIRVLAGMPLYLINRDHNEKLIIAKLLQPVSTPGHFESFFGVGGENPESFYTAFSNEILEAALNTKRENLERLFGGERKEGGVILKASEDQIKSLRQHEQAGESKTTINIFKERPSHSNQYGQLYEVSANELKDLDAMNVQISFLNLTKNAMAGPTYTSKATKISLVVDGEGYFEMACPHLSSQQSGGRRQSQRGQQGGHSSSASQRRGSSGSGSETSYQQVNTRLTRGTVVVIPAGHPYAVVASNNKQNLEMVFFEVNAKNSWQYALAGKGNVVNQFEKEAKELAFGVSSKEVDQVFKSQEEEFFFPGPRHQERRQHEGRASE